MSLRELILTAEDLPREPVEVPEWGATVYVREMTGKERDEYESNLIDKKDMPIKERLRNMRAQLVVLCTVDEDGQRIFSDDDVEAVGNKSAKALNRIVDAAQNMNQLSDRDIEETAGN